MGLFLCALGIAFIIEGLPYFAFPSAMKKWLAEVVKMRSSYLRAIGLLSMSFGLLLVFFGT